MGRIDRGQIHSGDQAVICRKNGTTTTIKLSNLYVFQDLQRIAVEEAGVGDIVAVSGIKDITTERQSCCPSNIEPLPFD